MSSRQWVRGLFRRDKAPVAHVGINRELKPSGHLMAEHFRPGPEREIRVDDRASVGEQVNVHIHRDSELIGYRETNYAGPSISGDATQEGGAAFNYEGDSSQNEQGTLAACTILIATRRARGEKWTEPLEPT
jgi:hypothetical protein